MIGRRSIVVVFEIPNVITKKPFEVSVQANKNYGVCDIELPALLVKEPEYPEGIKKESPEFQKYLEKKGTYDSLIKRRTQIRQNFLNIYQGRQLNSGSLQEEMIAYLYNALNA